MQVLLPGSVRKSFPAREGGGEPQGGAASCLFPGWFCPPCSVTWFQMGGGGGVWTPPGVEGGVKRISHCKSSFFPASFADKESLGEEGREVGVRLIQKSFQFNIKGTVRPDQIGLRVVPLDMHSLKICAATSHSYFFLNGFFRTVQHMSMVITDTNVIDVWWQYFFDSLTITYILFLGCITQSRGSNGPDSAW